MDKNVIEVHVPKEIDYMTQWKEYRLPERHCIIDKDICGCGFTEFCISNCNPDNVILCSPRKVLLDNKKDQHPENNVYYFQSEFLKEEFDSTKGKGYDQTTPEYNGLLFKYKADIIRNHILNCSAVGKHCVFLVTYDSFHFLKSVLAGSLKNFRVVVDEFQAIFLDSYFKANVEDEFFETLQDVPNVVYLSATPMLKRYMDMIDEFSGLPYYKFIWHESRIESADLKERYTSDLVREALSIIDAYKNRPLDCAWVTDPSTGQPFFSKEAVFYVNSVALIRRIIKRAGLAPSEVNIICSDDADNKKKIAQMKSPVRGEKFSIGHIPNPKKGEINKKFTFCTKTTYLGADMYSDSARTFVFSDANINSLSLDIKLDLPQILGRQRLLSNPWKNECVVFYKTYQGQEEITEDEFLASQKIKNERTETILSTYSSFNDKQKEVWFEKLKDALENGNVTSDFVRLTKDGKVVFNRFLQIADLRAFEVSKKENRTKFSVIRTLGTLGQKLGSYQSFETRLVNDLQDQIISQPRFQDKLKFFCEFSDKYKDQEGVVSALFDKFKGTDLLCYYTHFGSDTCRSVGYKESLLKKILSDQIQSDKLCQGILSRFNLNTRYTLKQIKEDLGSIYESLGINKTPKATDLENYYEVKPTLLVDPVSNKRQKGYLLISIK